ncbi:YnbE family lipoprotein [Sphingomonas sp. AX6]|uniref:YnbE family lipoprotein n=1 Tax=Sphingomonas sp. AX6 TaxID=2653171 RepID=UPI0012EF5380|nr:conserved hypothetical protein [Sphingomonas sp. AX6]
MRGSATGKGLMAVMLAAIGSTGLGGCVTVNAPDKPIEINLNINITQEVVYRLDGEAKALIEQNRGIF